MSQENHDFRTNKRIDATGKAALKPQRRSPSVPLSQSNTLYRRCLEDDTDPDSAVSTVRSLPTPARGRPSKWSQESARTDYSPCRDSSPSSQREAEDHIGSDTATDASSSQSQRRDSLSSDEETESYATTPTRRSFGRSACLKALGQSSQAPSRRYPDEEYSQSIKRSSHKASSPDPFEDPILTSWQERIAVNLENTMDNFDSDEGNGSQGDDLSSRPSTPTRRDERLSQTSYYSSPQLRRSRRSRY